MKIAPPTGDEKTRLKALYDYDVLDTEAEKVFDDYAFEQQIFLDNKHSDNGNTLSDFLFKPIEIEQIIRVLNRFLPAASEVSEAA